MAEQQRDRQLLRVTIVERLIENTARLAADQRHQEARIGRLLQDQLGGLDVSMCELFHFALAAAGQKSEYPDLQRDAHRLAHLGALGIIRQHVGKRMADVIDRDAGFLIELGFMREQREHVRYGALDLVDTLAAPRPDRRADVMDGGDAACLEREFQIEIEIRRVHRDEQVRAISQKILAQPAADADDLAIMAQYFDIAAHRQLFHREQYVHPGGLHLRAADTDELDIGAHFLKGCHQVAAKQIAGGFARDDADYSFFLRHWNSLLF